MGQPRHQFNLGSGTRAAARTSTEVAPAASSPSGTGVGRGARGHHVVDQQHPLARIICAARDGRTANASATSAARSAADLLAERRRGARARRSASGRARPPRDPRRPPAPAAPPGCSGAGTAAARCSGTGTSTSASRSSSAPARAMCGASAAGELGPVGVLERQDQPPCPARRSEAPRGRGRTPAARRGSRGTARSAARHAPACANGTPQRAQNGSVTKPVCRKQSAQSRPGASTCASQVDAMRRQQQRPSTPARPAQPCRSVSELGGCLANTECHRAVAR